MSQNFSIPTVRPQLPILGSLRWNTNTHSIETYTGKVWVSTTPELLTTWRSWFNFYIEQCCDMSDRDAQRSYIEGEMQARFPGNYRVDLGGKGGQQWVMVFDSPVDETWFHLKYE